MCCRFFVERLCYQWIIFQRVSNSINAFTETNVQVYIDAALVLCMIWWRGNANSNRASKPHFYARVHVLLLSKAICPFPAIQRWNPSTNPAKGNAPQQWPLGRLIIKETFFRKKIFRKCRSTLMTTRCTRDKYLIFPQPHFEAATIHDIFVFQHRGHGTTRNTMVSPAHW